MYRARLLCLSHRLSPSKHIVGLSKAYNSRSMATEESINQEILAQSALVKKLQTVSAETSVVDGARQKLGEMKKNLQLLRNASGTQDTGKKKERLLLKTAKVLAVLG